MDSPSRIQRPASPPRDAFSSVFLEARPIDTKITSLCEDRDRICREIHLLTVQHDVLQRRLKAHEPILRQRAQSLKSRSRQLASLRKTAAADRHEYRRVLQLQRDVAKEVGDLKGRFEAVYASIAECHVSPIDADQRFAATRLENRISLLRELNAARRARIQKDELQREDLQQNLAELERTERDLLQMRRKIDQRFAVSEEKWRNATGILVEPVDQIRHDGRAVIEIEREVRLLIQHAESLESVGTITADLETDTLIVENTQRRIVLEKKRRTLAAQKLTPRSSPLKKSPIRRSHSPGNTTQWDLDSFICERATQLEHQQRKIEREEATIDSIVQENEAVRARIQQEWVSKTNQIGSLQKSIRRIELLFMQIREKAEAIDGSARTFSELCRKHDQLLRFNQNIQRDRSRNSQFHSAIGQLKGELQQKEAETRRKDDELEERRNQIGTEVKAVDNLERQVGAKEKEVMKTEAKMAALGGKVEATVKALHEEQDLVAELLKRLPPDEEDQFQSLRELMEQID
jgi:chromosome segregation ATPase